MKGWHLLLLGALMVRCVATAHETAFSAGVQLLSLNIPSQPIGKALNEFARQSGIQVVFYSALERGLTSPVLAGKYTPSQALDLLLGHSGLRYEYLNKSTIAVVPGEADDRGNPRTVPDGAAAAPPAESSTGPRHSRHGDTAHESIEDSSRERLPEVSITGTLIPRGDSMSPVLVFGPEDFERAGAATAEEFFESLPQNFGGGQTEYTTLSSLGAGRVQPNFGFGTAVNLRGLGSSSTLILVNGRRLAVGGQAEFTDISMIPLSAVERIEVLTDGASALYGSDAVGGVVNFIMRRDYQAAETSVRTGTSTHDDAKEYDASQNLGADWTSGKALLFGEYHQRGSIGTWDRDFSRIDFNEPLFGPRDLVPLQRKQMTYATLTQDLGHALTLFGEGLYAGRQESYRGWDALGGPASTGEPYSVSADTEEYGIAVGVHANFNEKWQAEVSGNASRNVLNSLQTSPDENPLPNRSRDDLRAAEARLTGELLQLPAGPITLAAGTAYRNEHYYFADSLSAFDSGYHLQAVYSELSIPALESHRASAQIPLLTLSLAGRYEHYSSFGGTLDPKFGLRWAASDRFTFRTTYATSFRAPSAYQLSDFNAGRFVLGLPDPRSASGQTLTLVRFGNDPSVKPQTARTWSFGVDWAAEVRDTFNAQLTYFNVDYSNQIVDLSTLSSAKILDDPVYSNLAVRRGDVPDTEFNSLVESIESSTPSVGCSPASAPNCTASVAEIGAILDQRLTNIATTQTDGVDWTTHAQFNIGLGSLGIDTNTNYIIHFRQRLAAGAPNVEIANTAGNPAKLRIRATAQWHRGNWGASSTVNFTNRYSNRGSLDALGDLLPAAAIASWTTVDASLYYDASQAGRDNWLHGLRIAVTVTNLFDHDPPYIADGTYGFGFDAANATPFGRQVSVLLVKRWNPSLKLTSSE